jgi:hypothetical protein
VGGDSLIAGKEPNVSEGPRVLQFAGRERIPNLSNVPSGEIREGSEASGLLQEHQSEALLGLQAVEELAKQYETLSRRLARVSPRQERAMAINAELLRAHAQGMREAISVHCKHGLL